MPDNAKAEHANCPGCGAALELLAAQVIMTCSYCGAQSKIERRLRRVEPDLERISPPWQPHDLKDDYEDWGTERLVAGILNETDLAKRIAMARALDAWPHVHSGVMPRYVAVYVECMLTAPPELDKAMNGILGKMICSDDLAQKHCVIKAGEQYGFRINGSRGLLFALSLGDAATVKLLLDIAEFAAKAGDKDYAQQALFGVQTAIGREQTYHKVCTQILCHRLTYVSGQVAEWVMNFLKNEGDVGYRYHRDMLLEVMDAAAFEKRDLLPGLARAMNYCKGGGSDGPGYLSRLGMLTYLRSNEAKLAALQALGGPADDVSDEDLKTALEILGPFLDQKDFEEAAVAAIKVLIWLGPQKRVPPRVEQFLQARGDKLHRWLRDSWNLRVGR